MTPHFKHDCAHCVFLGHKENHDLWVCPKSKSFIARFGNSGPDYFSMPEFLVRVILTTKETELLTEAYQRAKAKNIF